MAWSQKSFSLSRVWE